MLVVWLALVAYLLEMLFILIILCDPAVLPEIATLMAGDGGCNTMSFSREVQLEVAVLVPQ